MTAAGLAGNPAPPQGGDVEKSGWLWKRTRFTHLWRPSWFHLRGAELLYGEDQQGPVKSIPLLGAAVQSADPLGWTITPQDRRRVYHLRAASAAEHERWMRHISAAQSDSAQRGAHTCVLQ
ncbi:unnamed protein product [Merluccius merluccius]